MMRKLLLTAILVVMYAGSPPHLAGSLLVTVFFLVMNLYVDPYMDQCLNSLQRLALCVQFCTIFSCICHDYVRCIDERNNVDPRPEHGLASDILSWMVIFLNGIAAAGYPIFR